MFSIINEGRWAKAANDFKPFGKLWAVTGQYSLSIENFGHVIARYKLLIPINSSFKAEFSMPMFPNGWVKFFEFYKTNGSLFMKVCIPLWRKWSITDRLYWNLKECLRKFGKYGKNVKCTILHFWHTWLVSVVPKQASIYPIVGGLLFHFLLLRSWSYNSMLRCSKIHHNFHSKTFYEYVKWTRRETSVIWENL